ncbi:MAG: mechanosensitive ion channel family protein [Gammaproteobacteria bacterium]|nr:mechanosensitive ion channel family protein [Gammaproteobacteria bacterium]
MHRHPSRFLAGICLVLYALVAAAADPGASRATEWERVLDRAERSLARPGIGPEELQALREAVQSVRDAARLAAQTARAEANTQRALLDALGPSPAAGEPAESREIVAKRTALEKLIAAAGGRMKAADLAGRRAQSLSEQLAAVELRQRASGLLVRGPSPLDPSSWFAAAGQLEHAYENLQKTRDTSEYKPPLLILVPVFAVLVSIALAVGGGMRTLLRRFGRDEALAEPSYPRRVLAAVMVALGRGLIPALVFSLLLVLAWNAYLKSLLDPRVGQPFGLVGAIMVLLLGPAFVRAAFSPRLPAWRIVPVPPTAAAPMARLLYLVVAITAFATVANFFFARLPAVPAELAAVYSFSINLPLSALLLLLAARPWSGAEVRDSGSAPILWPVLRALVVLVTLATPIANVLGYQILADFLLGATMRTLLLAAGLGALHVLLRELSSQLLTGERAVAVRVRSWIGVSDEGGRALAFWLGMLADTVLLLGGFVGVLLFWGVPADDLLDWAVNLTRGVSLGSYVFAPADVLIALLAFVLVFAITRVVQRLIEQRVFPHTRLDIGVRTAINAGIGYVGLVFALLYAISVLGIDLSKLAIIAGALSVGIGFGLQNIVNNFVSGLILLIERPVKIGDWVIVGSIEGYVRQINVRSTQIETFQRADVIIPNSELLQSAVVNWTHKNRIGRVDVAVGVAYASDIELVERILLEAARDHRLVERWPEPQVMFMNFGDSALEFELRVFLANIEQRLAVASALRKEITRLFREAGVEIPFPQRDLWLRNASAPIAADGSAVPEPPGAPK